MNNNLIQTAIENIRRPICDTYGVDENTADAEASNLELSNYVLSIARRALGPIEEYMMKLEREHRPAPSRNSEEEFEVDVEEENESKHTPTMDNNIEIRLSKMESKMDQLIKLLSTQSVRQTAPVVSTPAHVFASAPSRSAEVKTKITIPVSTGKYVPASVNIPTPKASAAAKPDMWGRYQKTWFKWKNAQKEGPPAHNGERTKMCSADYKEFKLLSSEQQEEFFTEWS